MKKRVLSLLLALLLMISVCPPLALAMGNNITIRSMEENAIDPSDTKDEKQEGHSSEDAHGIVCQICNQYDCTSNHESWCEMCNKDNCGIDHSICEICGAADCQSDHETWCAVCQKDDCGKEHTFCDICNCYDCGIVHLYCETCEKYDCGIEHNKGQAEIQCEVCGNSDCVCPEENSLCTECGSDPCICAEVASISVPACSGVPTCWGESKGDPLPNHVDGCVRKEYIKTYLTENSANAIAADWDKLTEHDKTDIIAMAEAYTDYADELKNLVNWNSEVNDPPACDCNVSSDIQYHATDCPLYLHWVNVYVNELTVEEIKEEWISLDKSTRESILALLKDNAPEKLEELQALLPDMTTEKTDTASGVAVKTVGDIPSDVVLETFSVTENEYNHAIYNYISDAAAVIFALDITLKNTDSTTWQPYEGETVAVSLDASGIGLSNGDRVRLLHDHEGTIEDIGTYTVTEGLLSFEMGKFSTIYVVSVTNVVQNAVDNVVYFDLNAGNVTIDGNNYTGFRFDGTDTAKEVTGTLKDGQSYYVYQSNESNKTETGLFNTATDVENPVYEMQLPSYSGVIIDGQSWGDYITNNTDVKAVITAWNGNDADKDGRTATGNRIDIKGVVDAELVIDNVWSTYSDHGATRTTGAIAFQPGTSTRSKLTLCIRGDNRVECVHYWSNKGNNNQIIFKDYDYSAYGNKNTITVADIDLELNGGHTGNYWCSAIGGDDGSCGNADGIVINSGIIYAGTTAEDDCTAIGGGGNDYGGITINGGVVTAVTSSSGTAIGGGIGKTSKGGQSKVVITDGEVYAYNFSCVSGGYSNTDVAYIPAAAIGGGSSARETCNSCTVEIHGGNVFARSVGGTAIGGGSSADTHGGASVISISGGIVDVASMSGTIGGKPVKAGASIGGGTGGTKGNGGDCTLTISGGTVYTGSIGGGKTISTQTTNHIGSAAVTISEGTVQGQVIMASGAASDCSFNMTGGTIDNAAALDGTKNADGDIEYTRGEGTYNKYTFLEDNGGAVYVENGVATLSGGTVRNTVATNGGAFYVTGGTFKMTGGIIDQSSAKETGGAICVVNGTANISDGTISNITAHNGGAVAINGGTFEMTGGSISGFNAATNGGAVYVMGGTAKVGGTITGSNTVDEAQKGGAVYVGGGTFEMTGGSMTACNAGKMGGAVCVEKVGETAGTATISNGEISNVYAPNGGAIAVSGGSFTMSAGSIRDVKATSDGTQIDGLGGAVYVNNGNATVTGGDITGHETDYEAGSGGGVYIAGGSFTMSGGTMKNFNVTGNGGMVCVTGEGAAATIQGGTISGTPAAGVNEAANGGAVYVVGGGSFTIDGQGEIVDCNATESGGGVYLADGTFTVQGGSFENCTAAVNGGGVYLGGGKFEMPGGSVNSCSAQNGGGVYLDGGTFNMNGGTFEACRVDANGGAVCIMNGEANIKGGTIKGDNTVSDNVISANKAEAIYGGGIYVGGGKLDMEAGTITRCSATNGGAAYIMAGECYMTGGTVSYNHAVDGGAMYVVNTPVTYGGLNNLTVEWNIATNNGGGMYIHNENKNTSITNGVIRNNTADYFGGGIYHEGAGGSCTVSGAGQIRGNTAKNGGGLYIIGGSTLNVKGGHITENRAVGEPAVTVKTAYNHADNVGVGGGVYVGPGTTISSSSFTMAEGRAAGIYANTADFAADDLYANIESTVLSLPDVSGMDLDGSMKATGWYADYAQCDTKFATNTLLKPSQFEDISDVTAENIERYRYAAKYSQTAPYEVKDRLSNVTGKYVCLTIGTDIINFGKIEIAKSGNVSADQYFVFRVQSTNLDNKSLDAISFEVTVRGNESVVIEKVPFGSYTVTEQEGWSWRYEVADRQQVSQTVDVHSSETAATVEFFNQLDKKVAYDNEQQSSLWLDGNSAGKVNIWNQKQATKGVFHMLDDWFQGKEDED